MPNEKPTSQRGAVQKHAVDATLIADQIGEALTEKHTQAQQEKLETDKNLSLIQTPINASPNEASEIAILRAQLQATQAQLQQEMARTAVHAASSFRQADMGNPNQEPIAVIDSYGHVHPFTTNNNDRVSLLKMKVQYIYTHADLDEALNRAKKIQNNEADVNIQMVGAGLSAHTGMTRSLRNQVNLDGMIIEDKGLQAINPKSFLVKAGSDNNNAGSF